jgi:hypothetical protein
MKIGYNLMKLLKTLSIIPYNSQALILNSDSKTFITYWKERIIPYHQV